MLWDWLDRECLSGSDEECTETGNIWGLREPKGTTKQPLSGACASPSLPCLSFPSPSVGRGVPGEDWDPFWDALESRAMERISQEFPHPWGNPGSAETQPAHTWNPKHRENILKYSNGLGWRGSSSSMGRDPSVIPGFSKLHPTFPPLIPAVSNQAG